MSASTSYDPSSNDYLMMIDGGQQGDGTELHAVTISPCESHANGHAGEGILAG